MRPIVCVLFLLAAYCAAAQDLPSKIRGYKVYKTDVVVRLAESVDASKADVVVRIDPPKIKSVGLTGTTVEITAAFTSLEKSGSVEMLTFHDVSVNGVAVDVGDQTSKFDFKKNVAVTLSPATASIGPLNSAKAAYSELTDSKADWRLTGTVFVFGRFKRLGLTFKRVIPIRFDLTIPNPLRK